MKLLKLIASLIISLSAGALGSLATIPNIPSWYAGLEKPFFNPPNWLFGPVWTILYILIGISLYFIWIYSGKKSKRSAYTIFGIQLILNALWSIAFFGLHLPWLGFIIILALLTSIILTMVQFYRLSKVAAFLLLPYLLWVVFASLLNLAIALLN